MKVIYIYNENLELVFEPYITSLEEFEKDKTRFYSLWKDSYHFSETELINPIVDVDGIREKNNIELVKEGIVELPEGQYLKNDEIFVAEIPQGLIKPYWDKDTCKWLEGANETEISNHHYDNAMKKYVHERNLVSLFISEYMCGIRGDEAQFIEVKEYLKSIVPSRDDAVKVLSLNENVVERPYILEVIEKEVSKNV